jgi:hypothetical protein
MPSKPVIGQRQTTLVEVWRSTQGSGVTSKRTAL